MNTIVVVGKTREANLITSARQGVVKVVPPLPRSIATSGSARGSADVLALEYLVRHEIRPGVREWLQG